MGNKITYGLENIHIAFMTGDAAWATPIKIPGAVGFTPAAAGNEKTFHADNGAYFVSTSNNGYTGELEVAMIPDAVVAEMLGWEFDTNGMMVEVATGMPKKFALMGQVAGDSANRRFVFYQCQASRPEKEHKTKGESIDPSTDKLKLTIMPIDVAGKRIVKGTIELGVANAPVYNAFFDAVTTPNKTPGSVVKTALATTIAFCGSLTQAKYTAGTWTALQTALTAATTVNANGSATQAQVNAAKANLDTAILGLVAV